MIFYYLFVLIKAPRYAVLEEKLFSSIHNHSFNEIIIRSFISIQVEVVKRFIVTVHWILRMDN